MAIRQLYVFHVTRRKFNKMSVYTPLINKNSDKNPITFNLYSIVNEKTTEPVESNKIILTELGQEILTENELIITTE